MACAMPSGVVELIEEFVPWSDELLNDMLYSLETQGSCICSERFDPPHKCIGQISVSIIRCERMKKGTSEKHLEATVMIYKRNRAVDANTPYEQPQTYNRMCPFDRRGLKEALEYVRDTVKMIKRRGLCPMCVARDPPAKRLRVGDTKHCGSCFLKSLCQ